MPGDPEVPDEEEEEEERKKNPGEPGTDPDEDEDENPKREKKEEGEEDWAKPVFWNCSAKFRDVQPPTIHANITRQSHFFSSQYHTGIDARSSNIADNNSTTEKPEVVNLVW